MKLTKCGDKLLELLRNNLDPVTLINTYTKYVRLTKQKKTERYEINGFYAHPLNRFLPCDKDGNVLEKPNKDDYIFEEHEEIYGNPREYRDEDYEKDVELFEEALDRILFKGCEFVSEEHDDDYQFISFGKIHIAVEVGKDTWEFCNNSETIEDLRELGLELTENTTKELM